MKIPAATRSLLGLALVACVFVALPPHTLPTIADLRTVVVHAVLVGIVGIGLTLVIAAGGIDLSVGSAVSLCGVVAALAARAGAPLVVVLLAGVACGVLCGLYNAGLVWLLRLPAFIVTLGTLGLFRGVAKWVSGSRTVVAPTLGLEEVMQPEPRNGAWVVAPGVWVLGALAVVFGLVLGRTVLGRHILAMGGNIEAARVAGVPVRRTAMATYVLCGVLVGIAACLQFGRITVGDPTLNAGLELEAIAAAVIGGAALTGGTGSILGTVIGAVMMAYLRNRCAALGWPNFVQDMLVGHLIIAAVAIDRVRAISRG